jgi:hypothetical protein
LRMNFLYRQRETRLFHPVFHFRGYRHNLWICKVFSSVWQEKKGGSPNGGPQRCLTHLWFPHIDRFNFLTVPHGIPFSQRRCYARAESATDYTFSLKDSLVGAQMLFVAFGALVLVPLLTGLNPNVALFTAGAGTLIFQFITKRMVPIFLASSFAFIAPIIYGVNTWGIPGTMCGLVAAGLLYVVLSLCIKAFGAGFLHKLLPPVVVGPVIMVIGLVLAPVAVHMAMGRTGDGSAWLVPQSTAMIVAGVALLDDDHHLPAGKRLVSPDPHSGRCRRRLYHGVDPRSDRGLRFHPGRFRSRAIEELHRTPPWSASSR